mmetsp:Transcript_5818/g.11537  ORF Transcript_5818/g.11537 Transcript_5818/m.11537 type:complete len:250 (-) Transcript_5818:1570-2319(-)
MLLQELHARSNVWRGGGFAAEEEALYTEPCRIREAARPRAIPGSILALDALQEVPGAGNGRFDLLRPVFGEELMERCQASERCCSALHVGVVDHDVAEDLRRVQSLVPAVPAVVLVCGEPSVEVLQCQENIAGVEESLVGDFRRFSPVLDGVELAEEKHALQTFTGTITDRPTVCGGAKWPAPLGHVPVVLPPRLLVLVRVRWRFLGDLCAKDLRPFEILIGHPGHLREFFGKSPLNRSLDGEACVPAL